MLSAQKSMELKAAEECTAIKRGILCQCGRTKMRGMAVCLKCWMLLPEKVRDALCRRIGHGFEAAYKEACRLLADVPHRCEPPPPDLRSRNK